MTNEAGNLKGNYQAKGQSILNSDPQAFLHGSLTWTQSTPTITLPCLKKKKVQNTATLRQMPLVRNTLSNPQMKASEKGHFRT